MNAASEVLRVLMVCTGNICRSPMAEWMFRDGLQRRVGDQHRWVEVLSAGTHAHHGKPMQDDAGRTLARHGVTGHEAFRAQQLTAGLVESADLVLTAAREHRSHVVSLVPAASGRTFTIRELGRLVAAVEPGAVAPGAPRTRGRAVVAAAAAMRGRTDFVEPTEDDIDDPYRRPAAQFDRVGEAVFGALQRPLDLLTGVRP